MPRIPIASTILIGLVTAGLTGCLAPPPDAVGIGFREARFQEAQAMRDWRACRDEGFELNRQAEAAGSPARYLSAARILEGCESSLGQEAAGLAPEERMRAYAIAIQARLNGGDPDGARAAVERFGAGFPGRDLYFDDGTSFIDSVSAVLSAGTGSAATANSANVSDAVAAELRRVARWHRG